MTHKICGYCRISVDLDEDKDTNTSIETQKKRIIEFIRREYPSSNFDPEKDFYVDRDRSGYTFEQRKSYQDMKSKIVSGKYNILVVKDLTRFSRRVSLGALELESLISQDARIIGCDDGVDIDKSIDPLTFIRLIFAEDTVTTSSKKVRNAIKTRQSEGTWICNAPYGYYIRPDRKGQIFIDEEGRKTVCKIFELYIAGYGYKSIAHYLTEHKHPTGRALMVKQLVERGGDPSKILAFSPINPIWSPVSVQKIITNDFYIGTLRQGVWSRVGINKKDKRTDVKDHKIFLNHHEAMIDMETWKKAQARYKKSTKLMYSNETLGKNPYTGFAICADCGSPMFAVGGKQYRRGYNCGRYMKHGLLVQDTPHVKSRKVAYKGLGCISSHYISEETLNECVKNYLIISRYKLSKMLAELDITRSNESAEKDEAILAELTANIETLRKELIVNERQRSRQIAKDESRENEINEMFDEMNDEIVKEISTLELKISHHANQAERKRELKNAYQDVLDKFDTLIEKESFTKTDINTIIDKIEVDKDKVVTIYLHSDIVDLFTPI